MDEQTTLEYLPKPVALRRRYLHWDSPVLAAMIVFIPIITALLLTMIFVLHAG